MRRFSWCLVLLLPAIVSSNPGLQVRISQEALYKVADSLLTEFTSNLDQEPLDDLEGKESSIEYALTEIRITHVSRGKTHIGLQHPGVQMKVSGFSMRLEGKWRYKYKKGFVKISDSGTFEGSAENVEASVELSIGTDAQGRPTLEVKWCSARVHDVSIKMRGGASWLYNLFIKIASSKIKDSLEKVICTEVDRLIYRENLRMQSIELLLPVGDLGHLDYRMISTPAFRGHHLESYHKGQFSFHGDSIVPPFLPEPFSDAGEPSMISLWISDYVMNSMSFALFNNDQLHYSGSKQQEGSSTTVHFDARCSEMPTFKFDPNEIHLNLKGNIGVNFSASGDLRVPVLKAALDIDVLMSASLDEGTNSIVKFKIDSYNTSAIIEEAHLPDMDDEAVTEAVFHYLRLYLIPELNELGDRGLELPSLPQSTLVNGKLTLHEHAIKLTFDVEV